MSQTSNPVGTQKPAGTEVSTASGSDRVPAPQLKKVKLAKDHEHGGEKYKAGDELEVNEADEKWLRNNKVI